MNFEATLRKVLLGGIFLIPFVPLIVATSPLLPTLFFPYITGKNFIFRILVELLLGGWIILALRNPAYRPRKSLLLSALGAFVIIVGFATLMSENVFKSFWSNFERMEGYITILHLFAYFVVASTVLTTEKLWRIFWNCSFVAATIAGLYALSQTFGWFVMHQGDRPDSTLGNATYLGGYMLFHVFVAAFYVVRSEGRKMLQWSYGVLAAFFVLIVYLTATRGAALGLVAGALAAALLTAVFGKEKPRLRKAAVGTVVCVLVLVGGFLAIRHTSFVQNNHVLERFASISLEAGQSRLLVWGMAWQGFKERPILGWGQESFNFVFNKYYNPEMYDQETWFDRVHNVFLDWLIAAGLLGLLLYLSLYAAGLRALWRKIASASVTEKALLTGLIVAYAAHNFFVFDNIASYILFFSLLAYLQTRSTSDTAPLLESRTPSQDTVYRVVAPAVIVLTLLSVYAFNIKGMLVARDLVQGLSQNIDPATNKSNLSINLAQFNQAIARNSFGMQEVREQLAQVASKINALDVDQSVKNDFFTLARNEMQKQIDRVPSDTRFQLFMATLLDNWQKYQDAIPYLQKAIELSPNKQVTYFEIGGNLLNQGKPQDALQAFKRAYELQPTYPDAQILYAVAAVYAGQPQTADTVLTTHFGSAVITDLRLIQAYERTGELNRAMTLLQKKVADSPNDWQSHLRLAAIYMQVGERQSAIDEIERVIVLNPPFKDQGTYFINEIRAGRNP